MTNVDVFSFGDDLKLLLCIKSNVIETPLGKGGVTLIVVVYSFVNVYVVLVVVVLVVFNDILYVVGGVGAFNVTMLPYTTELTSETTIL